MSPEDEVRNIVSRLVLALKLNHERHTALLLAEDWLEEHKHDNVRRER